MKTLTYSSIAALGLALLNPAYCATEKLSLLYSFNAYAEGEPSSNIVTADDGNHFYGHTDSSLYKFDTLSQTLQVLQKSRKGFGFSGNLVASPDKQFIYGMENAFARSAIFRISRDGKTKLSLHEFDIEKHLAEGYDNVGNVVITRDAKTLFGATESGGINPVRSQGGVIYQIKLEDTQSFPFKVLHSFSGKEDGGTPNGKLVISPDEHYIYGATTRGPNPYFCGTLFRITLDGSENPPFETLRKFNCDDDQPRLNSLVISKDGNTLYASSTLFYGSVIKIDLTRTGFPTTLLHKFQKDDDGMNPEDLALSKDDDILFGVSTGGQSKYHYYNPTIFKITIGNHAAYSIVHTFTGLTQPQSPISVMLNAENNKIYGVSEFGGEHNAGTLFQYLL